MGKPIVLGGQLPSCSWAVALERFWAAAGESVLAGVISWQGLNGFVLRLERAPGKRQQGAGQAEESFCAPACPCVMLFSPPAGLCEGSAVAFRTELPALGFCIAGRPLTCWCLLSCSSLETAGGRQGGSSACTDLCAFTPELPQPSVTELPEAVVDKEEEAAALAATENPALSGFVLPEHALICCLVFRPIPVARVCGAWCGGEPLPL